MLESIINVLKDVPWEIVLLIAGSVAVLENLFPPAPSDTVIIFTGTLVGINVVGFVPLLLASTLGSAIGFLIMFFLGYVFGEQIIDSKKFKFINRKNLDKPDRLFKKYGDLIIVANRFLSGTRAVISFFAGISKMPKTKTILLSIISALFWNAILISLGYFLGQNWQVADRYLEIYGWIIAPILIGLVVFFTVRWYLKEKKEDEKKEKKKKKEKIEA